MIPRTSSASSALLAAVWCVSILSVSLAAERHIFGDPPDETHPWGVQDLNRPQPPVVTPGNKCGDAPSDAIVLFDGSAASFKNWQHVKPAGKRKGEWKVVDGILQCTPGAGYIETVEEFGDCQLHVEWAPPVETKGTGQGRGNSGIFLMGKVEVQVLDNYENPTYADGTAGAVYGIMPPMANALKGPAAWQSYDIIFRRPIVKDGKVLDEGSITVLVNGVVVQDNVPLDGGGGWRKRTKLEDSLKFPDKGSLSLQDHGNPVRYRNIWYRPLRPRPVDGGTDGRLAPEAAQSKRAEIAQTLREAAKELKGRARANQLLDSLLYDVNEDTWKEAQELVEDYVKECSDQSKSELGKQKDETIELYRLLLQLRKYKRVSGSEAENELKTLIDSQGWKVRH